MTHTFTTESRAATFTEAEQQATEQARYYFGERMFQLTDSVATEYVETNMLGDAVARQTVTRWTFEMVQP